MASNDRIAKNQLPNRIAALLLVFAIALGGTGIGLGAYAVSSNGQGSLGPQGPQGPDGQEGLQGPAGVVGPVVSITQPGYNTVVFGRVSVRILLWNSTACTLELLVNGSLKATEAPWTWDTTDPQYGNGWWNVSVRATNTTGAVSQDHVIVFVDNCPSLWFVSAASTETLTVTSWVNMPGMALNFTIARKMNVELEFHTIWYASSSGPVCFRFTQNGTGYGGYDVVDYGVGNYWTATTVYRLVPNVNPGTYEIRVQALEGSSPGITSINLHSLLTRYLTIRAFDV
jgi:hypothetical protein